MKLRSDADNNLVVSPLVADSEIVDKLANIKKTPVTSDEVTIDESQFDMGPQKGLQQ